MVKRSRIIIKAEDYHQLKRLLASNVAQWVSGSDSLDELQTVLDSASLVTEDEAPRDIVTMNSTVSLRNLGTSEVETYTLVYPNRADIAKHKLSVLAPIGTAVLGSRVGDKFRWRGLVGWRNLRVEEVIYPFECGSELRFSREQNQ